MNDLEKITSEVFDRIMSLPVCENEDQRKGRKEVIDILRSVTGNDFGWISCDDRLPEKAGEYLVVYHPCFWDHVEWSKRCVGIDTFRGKTTWAKKKYQCVTHWMPLPAPTEAKKEGAED